MKILFMGTPDFAAVILRSLAARGEDIAAVFSQPEKPRGRGYEVTSSPVAVCAGELGIPVYTPSTLRDEAAELLLRAIAPELIIVVAYGKILPANILNYPKYGSINIHASLLPRWRGSAPIQRAIIAGDDKTGITVIQMDEGIDTGDMLIVHEVGIEADDNFETLHDKLAAAGAAAIGDALDALAAGTLIRTPQTEDGACYAAKIEKIDCKIDFKRTAAEIANQIRGLSPVPLANTRAADGRLLKIVSARPDSERTSQPAGTVVDVRDGEILVACGDGVLHVREVLPEGKRRMLAADFARGRAALIGEKLS